MPHLAKTLAGSAAIAAAFTGLLAAALGGQRSAPAASPSVRATPGSLQILNSSGQEVGLCPLKHTDVVADVSGFVARVNVKQQFTNPSHEPIEAVYTFPLPDDAAVDDMTMTVGNRVIKGWIRRREEARMIYDTARQNGQMAALLDQERPNIFTQSVANVMPGDNVTISISYVHLLKYDDGKYEFHFPMVVGPRYVPAGGYTTVGKRGDPVPVPGVVGTLSPEGDSLGKRVTPIVPHTDAIVTDPEKITPPITPPGTRAGHDISVTVNLDAGLPLGRIDSVLHKVSVLRGGRTRATIRLSDADTIPNKDFILRYTVAGQQIQEGVLTHRDGKGDGYFTLILQPPTAPEQSQISPKEMVFVIDQTGSQSGWPIAKAKETMRHCIQNLNPGDTFQLIGFNTEIYPCFPKPVEASTDTIAAALKFLDPIEGNGGTDILKSVDYSLSLPDDPNRLRIVCYMTDGYVGNDMQILDTIEKNRGRARMFPFGVGNSVNRFLIDGMAREGRGAAEYVTLNDDGAAAAQRFYHRIASPLLLDPQVDFGSLPVTDVYPKHIPDLFTAGPIILKGKYTRGASGDITVRGTLRGEPWSETIHVNLPDKWSDGAAIPTLWARDRIEDLQSEDWMGAQTGHPDSRVQEDIVQTALNYRLMSQYTSFVAVEQRVVNLGGQTRKIDVPVEMPDGVSYNGIFGSDKDSLSNSGNASRYRSLGLPAGAASHGLSYGGAFGGTTYNRPLPALAAAPMTKSESLSGQMAVGDFASGLTTDGQLKKLDDMTPADRKAALRSGKLTPRLQGLDEKLKKQGVNGSLHVAGAAEVVKGRITVQVWLAGAPKDALAKLKALGFHTAATLQPNRLVLGDIAVDKLDALIALKWVAGVEEPVIK